MHAGGATGCLQHARTRGEALLQMKTLISVCLLIIVAGILAWAVGEPPRPMLNMCSRVPRDSKGWQDPNRDRCLREVSVP
jgi:hypothetical protein